MIASISTLSIVIAKPVAPNPATSWPSGTIWGTNLRIENGANVGQAWFGAKTGAVVKAPAPPDPTDGLVIEFWDGATRIFQWVDNDLTAPQSYSWYVRMRTVGAAPANGTVSCKLENADTLFVPRDFSVILENAATGIFANLRKENEYVTGLPKYATLYVDNAVDIFNIENLDPLVGDNGDTLRLNVWIKNQGRENDNYQVTVGGSLDPWLYIPAGENDNVIVSTVLPNGTQNIVVDAVGDYASDQDYVTAQGGPPGVTVSISPAENTGENGDTVTFEVTVTNTGLTWDNYNLSATDDASPSWSPTLDDSYLELAGGDNGTTTLSVTIDTAAPSCMRDNITVTATAQVHGGVSDSDTCVAHAKYGYEVTVEALPPTWKETHATQELCYLVAIRNTGAQDDEYNVSVSDAWGATIQAPGVVTSENRSPTDDAYTCDNRPDQNTGSYSDVYVGTIIYYGNWETRRGYFQFDLSGIPAGSTVTSAKLNCFTHYGGENGYPYGDATLDVRAKAISNDSWDESTITWNNAPSMGATLDTVTVTPTDDVWYSWDVTSFVDSEAAGDQVASIGLISYNEAANEFVPFSSSESSYTSQRPYLELTYVSWGPKEDNVQIPVSAGDNEFVRVCVIVPYGTVYCDNDIITVTAVSKGDNTISDSDTVTAHSMGTVDVDVSIDPSWQEGLTGDKLYYKVTITNTGNVDGCYDVSLVESLPWGAGLQIASETLLPTDDIFSREKSPNTNMQEDEYWHAYHVYVGNYGNDTAQRAYFKFDLSALPDVEILDATLNLNAKYGMSGAGYVPDNLVVNAMGVDNDDWLENELTWNNAPPMVSPPEGPYDSVLVGNYVDLGYYFWTQWNVGGYAVIQRDAGDNIVSIGLIPENEAIRVNGWFYTKEGDPGYEPYLEVTYSDNSAPATTSAKVCIGAGESKVIDICVTVPPEAQHCDNNIITVEAVSRIKPSMSDSDDAIAHCALARVEVEITPDNQTAHASIVHELINPSVSYDPVTFTIAVTNTGLLDDLYALTAEDTLGWGVKVDPAEIFVPAGDTEYAVLSVTVPRDTLGDTIDYITVTAEGKMASDKQEIIRPIGSDTVSVVTEIIHGIELEVLPDCEPQTGAPDSPLEWLVVIKNTGNMPNTFILEVDDDWGATLDETYTGILDAFTKWTTILSVTVPENARTCDWDNILVTVTKEGMPDITDSVMVRAHCLEPGPRLPEGVIEIAVEAEVVAIDIDPVKFDFGVMDEHKWKATDDDWFTLRNTGNVKENILIAGTDAQSMPGEPVTTWELDALSTGVDQYMLEVIPDGVFLEEYPLLSGDPIWTEIAPGSEVTFGLKIYTPIVITTPARMWARVKLTAIAAEVSGNPV